MKVIPKLKIINDPIYGFITIPGTLIFQLIEHKYFQRLRRISQMGFSYIVYPGAHHTRFHHALGAMFLMQKAVHVLRTKGVDLSEEEEEALLIAILLHDIGHGPFSHALEHSIVNVHHEDLSILFMEQLNEEFNGALEMAISIFKNEYPKKYLHQLISSQLDMDRMDYLNRDSFFTGVSEGVIGYDRIIKMLNVYNGEIVVEYKGIYSIEKFLIARRIMYWQVYLHKTVVSAEQMLIRFFKRIKYLFEKNSLFEIPDSLLFFLEKPLNVTNFKAHKKTFLDKFAALDDIDITFLLKMSVNHKDFVLSTLAKNLLNRNLFKIDMQNSKFSGDHLDAVRLNIRNQFKEIDDKNLEWLIIEGSESNRAYSNKKDEIKFWMKNNQIKGLVDAFDHVIDSKYLTKYFLCYPKIF